jgi:hypothetical protein
VEKQREERKVREREAAERAKLRKKKEPRLQAVYMSEENRRLVEGVLKQLQADSGSAAGEVAHASAEEEPSTLEAAAAADALSAQLQVSRWGCRASHSRRSARLSPASPVGCWGAR